MAYDLITMTIQTQQNLKDKKCVPCEKGGKHLTKAEIEPLLKEISGWHLISGEPGGFRIQKKLTFIDFKRAISFINEVADIAEFEGHHPDLSVYNWNKVTISLQTHAVKGLSENDFILAAKIDQILKDDLSK